MWCFWWIYTSLGLAFCCWLGTSYVTTTESRMDPASYLGKWSSTAEAMISKSGWVLRKFFFNQPQKMPETVRFRNYSQPFTIDSIKWRVRWLVSNEIFCTNPPKHKILLPWVGSYWWGKMILQKEAGHLGTEPWSLEEDKTFFATMKVCDRFVGTVDGRNPVKTTWDVYKTPVNHGVDYLSAGAGFQPSTVSTGVSLRIVSSAAFLQGWSLFSGDSPFVIPL